VYINKVPHLYVDGTLRFVGSQSQMVVRPSNGQTVSGDRQLGGIGGGVGDSGGTFRGTVSEFQIYDRALSSLEVMQLYRGYVPNISDITNSTLICTNCTISSNSGRAGLDVSLTEEATLVNCTVAANTSTTAGGGICVDPRAKLTLLNTLVAKNTAPLNPDLSGTVTSLGHNFIGNSSGSAGWNVLTDFLNEDPKIGPLQDNGGPTWTHELLYGSLCINSGTMEGAPDVDQRGVNRPQGNAPDIGAYEGLPIIAPVILGGLTNQTAVVDSNVTWTVDVIGTKPLAIQWSCGGTNLPNATNTSLTLSNVKTNQAGLYTLSITNVAGEVSGSAFLTVLPTGNLPVITNQPASLSLSSGQTATFAVGASGSAPLRYQWQFNNNPLSNQTNAALAIGPVNLTHVGNYRVIVANIYGSATSAVAMLKVDQIIAAQGNEVLVPVRARRFNNIGSFQFSMHWNVDVIALQAVERFGLPNMSGQNSGTTLASRLTVSWESPSGSSQSVADDTPLFVLRFVVVGASGSSSPITIDGDPTPIEMLDGQSRPLIPDMVNGLVQVLPTIKLSGSILYAGSVRPVPEVLVEAVGTSGKGNTTTNGAYELRVPTGSSPVITPSKTNDNPLASEVTTGDILLIRRHILTTSPLGSPFKLLASDVNGDGKITTGDILSIRRFILGVTNRMPSGLWRFVPTDFTLDPMNPFGAPGYIVRSNQTADISGLNFVAVKLGDANLSWTNKVGLLGGEGFQPVIGASKMLAPLSAGGLKLTVGSGNAAPGGVVSLPVTVDGFNNISTLQFSIHWDPAQVAYTGMDQPGLAGLAAGNFGQPAPGTLTVSWEDPSGTSSTLAGGATLFVLNFQALGGAGTSIQVSIDGNPTPIEVLDSQLFNLTPALQAGTVTVSGSGVGVQIRIHPSGQSVVEGQPASFTVLATGTDPITYQWRKNGMDLEGATLSALNIAHALASDAGTYTVVVDNAFGPPVESSGATLTVNPASGNQLTFAVGSATVQPGNIAVVPVKVMRFINVSSLQFSAHWDTNQLAYEGLEQFGLTALGAGNFGQPGSGTLTLSWEDPSGGSSSLPDQTVIFALRLRALGVGTSQVVINSIPTPIEVLDGNLAAIPVAMAPGQVNISGGPLVDTDGDGLTDEQEFQLGTNPNNPDTDGDGYNDGLEVSLGTDPKSADSQPEALTIYSAVELEFATLTNRQYQLEFSTNLSSWTPYGSVFGGTDSVANQLISIKGTSKTFWRLRVLP
jgi:hypothetical protein